MDINIALEKRNVDLFSTSVIEEANNQADKIVRDAQKKHNKAIEQANSACEEADRNKILAAMQEKNTRDFSSLVLENRQQLLTFRRQLVEGLFGDVEKKLEEFTAGEQYGPWLSARLAPYAASAKGQALTIHLRKADSQYEALLQKAAPGCSFTYTGRIHLGGMFIQTDRLLADESLDARLENQRQTFTRNQEFML